MAGVMGTLQRLTISITFFGNFHRHTCIFLRYYPATRHFRNPSPPPPHKHKNFTYCELGCGNGISTNIFASLHPEGQFLGVDYMPSHIVFASDLAQQAHLDNINFLEADFRHLGKENIPPCDFIVCHDVYSWISEENQIAIRKFVRDNLKPGGIFYISYNCLPGWATIAPIQHLFQVFGEGSTGNVLQRVDQAIEKVDQALTTNKGYFALSHLQKKMDQIRKEDKTYVAHEYFNQDWNPLYHTDIVQHFQDSKMSYIGSANLHDFYWKLALDSKELQLIGQYTDRGLQETLKDYFLNNTFRRDLFIRDPQALSSTEQKQLLLATKFTLTVARQDFSIKMEMAGAQSKGDPKIYFPIADALEESSKTLDELTTLPALKNTKFPEILRCICFLHSSGQISIAEPLTKKAVKTTKKMNLAILQQSQYSNKHEFLVYPSGGTGGRINWLHQLFIHALLNDKPPEETAWQTMRSLGAKMTKEGKLLESDEDNIAMIHEKFLGFEQRRPQLFRLLGLEDKL